MSEKLIDYFIKSDKGVDSIEFPEGSQERLSQFQDALKGAQSLTMNGFINRLNALTDPKIANALRTSKGEAPILDAPRADGESIPILPPEDPKVTEHNSKIQAIAKLIDQFNMDRGEFLSNYREKHLPQFMERFSPPKRNEPRVGTKPSTPTPRENRGGNQAPQGRVVRGPESNYGSDYAPKPPSGDVPQTVNTPPAAVNVSEDNTPRQSLARQVFGRRLFDDYEKRLRESADGQK